MERPCRASEKACGHRSEQIHQLDFFIADMSPRKGQRQFVQSLPQILTAAPDVRLALIGYDDIHPTYVAATKADAQRLGVESHICWTGFREDIPALLAALDLLVLPSFCEPFGMVLVEAMACGVPVVATAAGGVREIVTDGVTGTLATSWRPHDLSRAVIAALGDSDRCRRMAEEAGIMVRDRFHTARQIAATEAILASAVGENFSAGSFPAKPGQRQKP